MAEQASKVTDNLVGRILGTVPLMVMLGGFVWQMSAQQASVDTRLKNLEDRTNSLAAEQVAGRTRGDISRNVASDTRQDVAVLKNQMGTVVSGLESVNDKLDRLLERKFGSVDPSPLVGAPSEQ